MEYIAGRLPTVGDQLNLVWWGVWIVGGLLLMKLVQPYWDRLFNWWGNPA